MSMGIGGSLPALIREARRLENDYGDSYEVMLHMADLADALEASAARVAELESRLAARDKIALAAVFLADAIGIEGLEEDRREYETKLTAPLRAERDELAAEIRLLRGTIAEGGNR